MAYIILLGIIKLQAFFKLVVKFFGRGLNIYVKRGEPIFNVAKYSFGFIIIAIFFRALYEIVCL
ncbi:MAG: hypothetical protein A6F70_10225 [Cycloclasticus sp. symbiont of Bathymodiolus heckerae]|nr:MAG: hypothetical protein A6F70_10225 [Cycloclasticus sp. symbiont of Bathymodiolus heckerae]